MSFFALLYSAGVSGVCHPKREREEEKMSLYQIKLLLEALTRVYSSQELSASEPVVACLVNHLGFGREEAEVFVTGALELKEVRARLGEVVPQDTYIQ